MKLLGWLSKLILSTVLISLLSVVTAWAVVNMYVEELLRQFQIPAIGKKIQFMDFAARLSEELNIVKPRAGGQQAADGGSSSTGSTQDANAGGASPDASSGAKNGSAAGSTSDSASTASPDSGSGAAGALPSASPDAAASAGAEDDAVAVMGQVHDDEAQQRELVMSTEAFAKKKEQLTSEDKMKIFSLVVAKLPQNEVQRLSALLEDGITAEELKEVDQTLHSYLTADEYKQLMEIIQKY
ncbi:hypothetical protein B5M42_023815 [Paenibacillus athensensis]|uniref:Uncharacterized protein n=1 Tax=Paenibacillus athensensis TaxID=1967502 RepID=A0A4Y8PVA6_9BACL|nr:hypothetical protein [Paenibacillus athensensis]MCD1261827.1 hypothetical protein [Paenibacillus athensensis]